jgi:hypothetical protein
VYCMACGEQLPDDAAFGSECGAPQRSPHDEHASESHEEWVARLGREVFEATAPSDRDRPAWKSLLLPYLYFQWWYALMERTLHWPSRQSAKAAPDRLRPPPAG